MPFVPGRDPRRGGAFARFEGGCLLCTTVEAELADGIRVVYDDDRVVVVCPFWAGSPYEMLVIPRDHDAHLQDAEPADLGGGRPWPCATCWPACARLLGDVAYNLVFHTAPHHHDGPFHWHVHLWPKLVADGRVRAGHRRADQHHAARVRGGQELRPSSAARRRALTATLEPGCDEPPHRRRRPPAAEAVWAHRRAHRAPRRLDGDAVAIRFDGRPGARGVGTRFVLRHQGRAAAPHRPHGDHRVGARRGDGRAPHRCRHRDRPLHAHRSTRRRDASRWEEDLRFPWYLGGPVAGVVGGRVLLARVWRRNLANLKRLVEAGDAGSG